MHDPVLLGQARRKPLLDADEAAAVAQRLGYGGRCPDCGTFRNNGHHEGWEFDPSLGCGQCEGQTLLLLAYLASGVPGDTLKMAWDPDLKTDVFRAVTDYIECLDENVAEGAALGLFGPPGTGKTAGGAHIVKTCIKRGIRSGMTTFNRVLEAEKRLTEESHRFYDRLRSVRLLVVDEIETPKTVGQIDLYERSLKALYDDRYSCAQPTLLLGNIAAADLAQHYPTVHSRLAASGPIITTTTADLRFEVGRPNRKGPVT